MPIKHLRRPTIEWKALSLRINSCFMPWSMLLTVFLTLGKDISWINMNRRPSKKSIRQSRASLIILITLAFLLMIAAVALAISLPDDEDRRAQTTTTTANTPALSGFACSATEASQMYPFETGVMKLTIGRVAMLDIRGAERFSVDLDYETPFAFRMTASSLSRSETGIPLRFLDQTGLLYEAVLRLNLRSRYSR